MIQLSPNEARVLGVLIEKAQTTPAQYPLSLNALVAGCNQKSNRDPVTTFEEDAVLDAIDSLRSKGLVREVMLSGSRVQKFRHVTRDVLDVDTNELVVLAELLLRGPQTIGELRGRASRMHALESTDIVKNVLEHLAAREEPMVEEIPPAPGSRAPRYVQRISPGLHPLDTGSASAAAPTGATANRVPDLEQRLQKLESDVEELKQALRTITQALGEPSVMRGID